MNGYNKLGFILIDTSLRNVFITYYMSTQEPADKLAAFNSSVRFLLERSNNGIRDGVNDSELNSILHTFKAGSEGEKIALADRASYYAELAKAKRAESKPSKIMSFSESPESPTAKPEGEEGFVAKLTGYYPANTRMEGGFVDRFGNKLYTLQDYLEGKAPYVSVAADKPLSSRSNQPYISIPSLEAKYGMKIKFKICDTGSAFYGKGTGRLDICTRSHSHSVASEVNASGVDWHYDAVV